MDVTFEAYEELLSEKLDRVKEMHSLTLIWYDLLKNDEVETVKNKVEQRGNIIDYIGKIDKKLEEFKSLELSPGQIKKTNDVNAEIRALKDDMIRLDEKLKGLFETKMIEVQEEIKELNAQKKRVIAYGGLDYSAESMYFNKTN